MFQRPPIVLPPPVTIIESVIEVESQPVIEMCLGCICSAMASCDETVTCNGVACGMFLLSKQYWVDSGKPVLEGDNPIDKEGKPTYRLKFQYDNK